MPGDVVELSTPGGRPVREADLLLALDTSGLVLLAGADEAAARRLVGLLGAVVAHPDADPLGRTLIEPRAGRPGRNARAFSARRLLPHTDGTAAAQPPDLVLVWCERPAQRGGEAVFVDGAAVLAGLATAGWPTTRLARSLSLWHRYRGVLGPVIRSGAGGRLGIRYRDDEVGHPVSATPGLCRAVRAGIAARAVTRPLGAGCGYLLDNYRWLHGRRAYSGDRTVCRILVRLGARQAGACGLGLETVA
jgi:TfdA family taurine catabolism dioxygenase TauD